MKAHDAFLRKTYDMLRADSRVLHESELVEQAKQLELDMEPDDYPELIACLIMRLEQMEHTIYFLRQRLQIP